jgi:hypothetical protein
LAEAAAQAEQANAQLNAQLAAGYLGASGDKAAKLLRVLFDDNKYIGALDIVSQAERVVSAEAQAQRYWYSPLADNLPLSAETIPSTSGYYSRSLGTGYLASVASNSVFALGQITDDARHGTLKDEKGKPITPWEAMVSRLSSGSLDNILVQSAITAPFIGHQRAGSHTRADHIWNEAASTGAALKNSGETLGLWVIDAATFGPAINKLPKVEKALQTAVLPFWYAHPIATGITALKSSQKSELEKLLDKTMQPIVNEQDKPKSSPNWFKQK